MKKSISLITAICLALTLTACGGGQNEPAPADDGQTSSSAEQNSQQEDSAPESKADAPDEVTLEEGAPDEGAADEGTPDEGGENTGGYKPTTSEKLEDFNQDATITETVLYEKDGIKITATQLTYSLSAAFLELVFENNTDQKLYFYAGSDATGNSINGYMINGTMIGCYVDAGTTVTESIQLTFPMLLSYGIDEIADIELNFQIGDEEFNYTYTDTCVVKTSLAEQHDYSKDYYKENYLSDAAMNTFEYTVPYFTEDVTYEQNGVKMLSAALVRYNYGYDSMLLQFENTSDTPVLLSANNITINGIRVTDEKWDNFIISPGKRGFVSYGLSTLFPDGIREAYGIKQVGSVAFKLAQRDEDQNPVSEDVAIEIVVPGVDTSFDTSGMEVYNKDGVRIVTKALIDDPDEAMEKKHILFFVENTSDKEIRVDQVYNSLKVNGTPVDYYFTGAKLLSGETAFLEVEIRNENLAEININSCEDITEAEMMLDIYDATSNPIDEFTIKMTF